MDKITIEQPSPICVEEKGIKEINLSGTIRLTNSAEKSMTEFPLQREFGHIRMQSSGGKWSL